MKAMMSEKLRDILNDPQRNRELQKQLSGSPACSPKEDQAEVKVSYNSFNPITYSTKHHK